MKYFDTAKRWYEKSLLEENPVDRFQCLWIAFNALYGDQPGKFETNQITNFVREHYSSSQDKVLEYKRYFEEPIPNLRILYSTSSKDTRSQIAILERNYEDNEEKIKALLLCVYQVHRNIFCPEGSFATQRYSEEEIIAYASKALEIYLKDFFEHYTDPINFRILQYIDVLIDPNSGDLPTVRGKRRTVAEISDFIKGHKGHLPLLYRYSPADYYNVSALLDGSVYLVSAAHMNDFWEGKVVDSTNPNIDLVETLKKNQEEIYLKSFSSDRNSSVMWQKYAGNYTGLCVTYIGKSYTAEELIKEILKDRKYFESSGDGVTFSGGEPMLHPEYLQKVLKLAKEAGLHTAIDTAGNIPFSSFEMVLPYTDLFLYDVKIWDEQKHRQATGVSNQLILDKFR